MDDGRTEPMGRAEIMAWRKSERERLIAARLALPAETRAAVSVAIAADITRKIGDFRGRTVSFYWPFRGEPDLRDLMAAVTAGGGRSLLPVVVAKGEPLVFRPWQAGEPLTRGIWNIPIPETDETALPDVVIAPLVGFDSENYRLGYGGGFFDRTLAALPHRPVVFGVGYALQRLESIHPLAHDIPMDEIVLG